MVAVGRGHAVGGTLVNLRRTVGKRAEFRITQKDQVGVVITALPVLDIVGPGLAAGQRFGHAVVVDQQIAVIIRIQEPGH